MTFNDDAMDRFLEPWKYPNKLGIPEIDFSEIKVVKPLGRGKKSSVSLALWNGKEIALKKWKEDNYNYQDTDAYSYWELLRYCDLKESQGKLIPELYFITREKETNTPLLGLELGQSVRGDEPGLYRAKNDLQKKLKKEGWIQRSGSWRDDNLVWMQNEDKSKRLVAIDLESFIPYFGSAADGKWNNSKTMTTPFGLEEVSPINLRLDNCDESWEWVSNNTSTGTWMKENKPVRILSYKRNRHNLQKQLERYELLKSQHGILLPRPLFVSRERDGTILLVLEDFKDKLWRMNDLKGLRTSFENLGWVLGKGREETDSIYLASFGTGSEERPIVYNLVRDLERFEPAMEIDAIMPHSQKTNEIQT